MALIQKIRTMPGAAPDRTICSVPVKGQPIGISCSNPARRRTIRADDNRLLPGFRRRFGGRHGSPERMDHHYEVMGWGPGVGIILCLVLVLSGCGGGKTQVAASTSNSSGAVISHVCPVTSRIVTPGTKPGSCGRATLTGAVSKEVNAPLEMETSCVLLGEPRSTDTRSATWSTTVSPPTASVQTDWVVVNWTTADVGKMVTLTPDRISDPPRVGVQFSISGNEEYQWVSTGGTLTISPSGTGGSLNASLSPDHGVGHGMPFPGTGIVSMQAEWTC